MNREQNANNMRQEAAQKEPMRPRTRNLLTLLALGVKNIHLGPTLPAFLSPAVAKVLVENFGIAGIGTVEDDIRAFFG